MAEYVKTTISALSSRSSDHSDPHVILRDAAQTQTDEKVIRVDGRLEGSTTVGTSQLTAVYDFYDLTLQGITIANTFIIHNRGSNVLNLNCYILLGDISGDTLGVCTFSGNNQIDSALSGAFVKGHTGMIQKATHVNTYGAKSGNNNDFAAITSISLNNTRLIVSGTPFGTNEAEDSSGSTLGVQLLQFTSFYVPAGGILSLPGQIGKIKANYPNIQNSDHEIQILPGSASYPVEYTLFMSGTVG